MTSLRRVQSCLIITHKMLFIFYIVLHGSNMAFAQTDGSVQHRFIKEDHFKMPIFGSYMYDPIRQEFEGAPYNINDKMKPIPTTTTTTSEATEIDLATSAEKDENEKDEDRSFFTTSTTITTHRDKRPTTTEKTIHSEITLQVQDTRTKAPYRKKNLRARGSSESSSSPYAVSKRPKKHHKKHRASAPDYV